MFQTPEDKKKLQKKLIAKHHLFMMKEEKLTALFETADEWFTDAMATRTSDQAEEEYTHIIHTLVGFGRTF